MSSPITGLNRSGCGLATAPGLVSVSLDLDQLGKAGDQPYAHVSSTDQSTAFQVARLKEAGCQVIRRESASGRKRDGRTELATILDFIRPGDTLVVVKLDRLGRSTRDVLKSGA